MTDFFCSWGNHHMPGPLGGIRETFDEGTMCLECQMKIGRNLTEYLPMPAMSIAMRAYEMNRKQEEAEKQATVKRIRAGSGEMGFVYYMRMNGQIKIGYAADVTARMRAYPPGTQLLAVEPGSRHLERQRHQDFHRDLVRGREWFAESAALRIHMFEMFKAHGDPAALAYEYTKRGTR